jgi:hypothetical protein
MAFFDVDGTRLYLGVPTDEVFVSKPILYFTVEDIDSGHAHLVERGVTIVSSPAVAHRDENGELWLTFFETPDGHINALLEERPHPG